MIRLTSITASKLSPILPFLCKLPFLKNMVWNLGYSFFLINDVAFLSVLFLSILYVWFERRVGTRMPPFFNFFFFLSFPYLYLIYIFLSVRKQIKSLLSRSLCFGPARIVFFLSSDVSVKSLST